LPIPRSRADRKVPGVNTVKDALNRIDRFDIRIVYDVLVWSGLRLRHAVMLLNNLDEFNVVELDGYYRVDLEIESKTKKASVAHLLRLPEKLEITEDAVSNYAAKKNILRPKYLRKFAITHMHIAGVESDIIRFISGHLKKSVHEESYYEM